MIDVLIQEQGSGGEMVIRNNDLVTVDGYENQPYAAHFGGKDWWGNELFLQGSQQFTSETEDVLNTTPLTSSGRIAIEDTMKRDISYLVADVPGTTTDVSVVIPSRNRIDAIITINGSEFNMNWQPDISFLQYRV